MPSLRKRVSSYFRQLSFHNETREKRHNINENTFVTKYLQGLITLREGPPIIYGKNPTDLPNYELGRYEIGSNTIISCYSGPCGGLTTVKRTEKHLSVLDADIDFIDTHDEESVPTPLPKKSPQKISPGQPIDNTTMVIKVAGHEYCVTNKPKRHSKSHSLGSISDLNIEIEKTKIEKSFYCSNNNCETVDCKNNVALNENDLKEHQNSCDRTNESLQNDNSISKREDCQVNGNASINNTVIVDAVAKTNQISKDKNNENQIVIEKPVLRNADLNKTNLKHQRNSDITDKSSRNQSYGLSKSQSEGNPFHHKKRGRIIKIDRPTIREMPSLRKRVSSYFRQLSFHNETREKRHNINENTFVTKYLQGLITLREGPPIIYGKNPTDLPNYELGRYEIGSNTIISCYSGPCGGLTTVKRTEKHLSVLDADIDFIDTHDEESVPTPLPKKSPQKISPGQPIDNTTMVIKVAGHEYCVTNKPKRHSKSHSLGSISDLNIEIEKTKIEKSFYCSNNNCETVDCKNNVALNENDLKEHQNSCDRTNESLQNDNSISKREDCQVNGNASINNTVIVDAVAKTNQISKDKNNENQIVIEKPVLRNADLNKTNLKHQRNSDITDKSSRNQSYGLSKSQSEGNPFHHKKRGRIIKIDRPTIRGDVAENSNIPSIEIDDSKLPNEWNRKSEFMYGLSDSLYDRNQVTRSKNGDPIADCFGIIARNDSAILAVADGVNWGEKASIAAKSAVHGSLHYLNKTIFNDTKPFENLTIKTDETSISSSIIDENINLISNTREVFICLLRAFNCAHDLILENNGMLTTLTVAVILPLKQKLERRIPSKNNGEERRETETQYVCCVCNVGDTLAYVYSQKHGVRELTKGSHDINCNRDMRDALGALGPVDGINPELSNLTLSITTLRKGDIVVVASDGLTDNFDPNVCRFTVNSNVEPAKPKKPSINKAPRNIPSQPQLETKQNIPKAVKTLENPQKPPVKPPRRSKNRDDSSRSSAERSSVKSATMSEKSSSQSVENESLSQEVQGRDSKSVTRYNQQVDLSSTNKAPDTPNNQDGNSNKLVESSSNKPLETSFDEPCDNTASNKPAVDYQNPLVQQFMRENSVEETPKVEKNIKKPAVVENKASSLRRQASSQHRQDNPQSSHKFPKQKAAPSSKTLHTIDDKNSSSKNQDVGYKFLRSKTTLDIRSSSPKQILRNEDGIPYVTPIQRYELQLLLIEDILKHGISGRDSPCTSARKLCENLVSFTISITSAKRHTLEDQDLYFDNRNGVLVEVSGQEKKMRRKKGLERVQNLPGKLDHVTVVAYNVGNFAH